MNDLRKVLVVDTGHRSPADPLSIELAELGFSSVTTSVEAADEVIELLQAPSAIFLNLQAGRPTDQQSFLDLAARLRTAQRTMNIPVILWDEVRAAQVGGVSAVLASEFGSQVLLGSAVA